MNTIKLIPDKKTFYAGEVLSGVCQVYVAQASQIPSLMVKFEGVAEVMWTDRKTTHQYDSATRQNRRETIEMDRRSRFDVISMHQDIVVQHSYLQSGTHRLPFAFQLPPNLVSSFETAFGWIRYTIQATPPRNFSSFSALPIGVVAVNILQAIDVAAHLEPVHASAEETVCCCCIPQGEISIEANTDRGAYCPNDQLVVSAVFCNGSTRKARPYIHLLKKVYYFAEGDKSKTVVEVQALGPIASTSLFSSVKAKDSSEWKDAKFVLPLLTPTISGGPGGCPIINVSYFVEIGLKVRCASNVKVFLPVTIGTVPFRSQIGVDRPPPYVVNALEEAEKRNAYNKL